MKKPLLILFLLFSFAFAEDFSEMSTQELIAIIGYVKQENQKDFWNELQKRLPEMTPAEKKEYEKNLKERVNRK